MADSNVPLELASPEVIAEGNLLGSLAHLYTVLVLSLRPMRDFYNHRSPAQSKAL